MSSSLSPAAARETRTNFSLSDASAEIAVTRRWDAEGRITCSVVFQPDNGRGPLFERHFAVPEDLRLPTQAAIKDTEADSVDGAMVAALSVDQVLRGFASIEAAATRSCVRHGDDPTAARQEFSYAVPHGGNLVTFTVRLQTTAIGFHVSVRGLKGHVAVLASEIEFGEAPDSMTFDVEGRLTVGLE